MVLSARGMQYPAFCSRHNFAPSSLEVGVGCFGLFCIFCPEFTPVAHARSCLVPCSFFAHCCEEMFVQVQAVQHYSWGPPEPTLSISRIDIPNRGVWALGCSISSLTLGACLFIPAFPVASNGDLICIAPISNANECLCMFYCPFGYPFGKEMVHIFCMSRFLTEQAQGILDSLQRDSLEEDHPAMPTTCRSHSPLGATSPSGMGSPLVLEANKPVLIQFCLWPVLWPGLAFAMD